MHIGQRYWRSQGLGTKLAITNFVWVASILGLLVMAIAWGVTQSLRGKMENEMQQGTVSLKNMQTGEQQSVTPEEVIEIVK